MNRSALKIRLAFLAAIGLGVGSALGDTLYVTEATGQAVTKIASGVTTRILNLTSTSPTGIAYSGNILWAAAGTRSSLINASLGGNATTGYGGYHYGLATDNSGNFFASETGAIDKFTAAGVGSTFATTGLSGAQGITFDFVGNLYAANSTSNTIEKFAPDGTASVYATGLSHPNGLAFDSWGNLFVSNDGNNTITRITNGVASVFASTGLNNPQGLAFDSSGALYAANAGDGTIEKFARSGSASVAASGLNGPYGLVFLSTAGTPVPVPFPEPSVILSLSGIGACVAVRRRCRA